MNGRTSTSKNGFRVKPLVACLSVALAVAGGSVLARDARMSPGAAGTHYRPATALARIRQTLAEGGRLRARAPAKVLSTSSSRPAGTLLVTNCDDDGGAGTLRTVVASAANGDTIDLSALTCSTITLAQGAVAVDVDDLTLQGPGAQTLTIDGADADSVIAHYGAGTLAIDKLTIAHGRYDGGSPYPDGGCIYSSGSVTLADSTVTACLVGSPPAYIGEGAGVFATQSLTITASTISNSVANYYGGGGGALAIGAIQISDSTFPAIPLMAAAAACWQRVP